ncbi:hypothetical protein TUMEXPCC7403_25150 [Tumidithrix helvetica PCC 7403]|uniref:hypothetical protein n=1 Tax=Tumidithrix helvetica TaxID=3457545 RepID=UPI003C8D6E45
MPSPSGNRLPSPIIQIEKKPVVPATSPRTTVPKEPTEPTDPANTSQDRENLDDKLSDREDAEQDALLKGDLPCLDASAECVRQLQDLAIKNSPELKAIEIQIANAGEAVKLAKVQGQGSFFETITPYVAAIAPILLQNSKPLAPGEIRASLDSRLLFEALPTIISGRALSDANQTKNNQANADLQIKLGQLEKAKNEATIAIAGKVLDALIQFEQMKDQANLETTIVKREEARSKLIEIAYRMGESSTIEQIARLNEFDRKKISAAQTRSRMRAQAGRIQRLVKGNEN